MKNYFSLFLLCFSLLCIHTGLTAQSYQDGEWLKFRIHYGWFNASYATLEVNEEKIGNTPIFHVTGKGKSTGLLHAFFKVDDTYESFIEKSTQLPVQFKRNINEGGYIKNKIIYFFQRGRSAKVRDLKHDTEKTYTTEPEVQDMISVFYYVRNQIDGAFKKEGDSLVANMFFDEKNFKFKTVYLGQEVIKTKFGKVETLKLRPYVQSGRVFKEDESLTVWVTADGNKIPVRIKAKLSVGSLTADIDDFKNLKHEFKTVD